MTLFALILVRLCIRQSGSYSLFAGKKNNLICCIYYNVYLTIYVQYCNNSFGSFQRNGSFSSRLSESCKTMFDSETTENNKYCYMLLL